MIDDIKQAIFNAADFLNWTPGSEGHFLFAAAKMQDHYNKAVKQWSERDYPPSQVVTLAWITSTSAAKASLLWLQEMNLVIQSLNAFEYEHDRILSEAEAYEMLREALRDWHRFDPSKEEVSKMRSMIMAQLTVEGHSAHASEKRTRKSAAADRLEREPKAPLDSRIDEVFKKVSLSPLELSFLQTLVEVGEGTKVTFDDLGKVWEEAPTNDAIKSCADGINKKLEAKKCSIRLENRRKSYAYVFKEK